MKRSSSKRYLLLTLALAGIFSLMTVSVLALQSDGLTVLETQDDGDSGAGMLTATSDAGDWYGEFDPAVTEYTIIAEYGTEAITVEYTVEEGATATIDGVEQTPDEDGVYSATLAVEEAGDDADEDEPDGVLTVAVASEEGDVSGSYTFNLYVEYSEDVPDAVVDYLCIGSQYTNSQTQTYGEYPEQTLAGVLKSVGNFGGYITYYFEEALVDDPSNEYGVDLYIYGNASELNRNSLSEPGQVYVSEDGDTWYALAGSEHYEETTIWDYTIEYTRTDDDGAWWTDSLGNQIDTSVTHYNNTDYPTSWPSSDYYYLGNTVSEEDTYTYTGILLRASDGSITGDGSTSADAALVDFGYVDCYSAGTIGESVNPYTATASNNGFDLAWAVDDDGNPIDVSDMEFHYVKVATASNIWASILNEKSTEVNYIVRATATDSAVGETDLPESVTVFCGDEHETVELVDGQQVYEVEIDATGDASILVSGTADDDAIWVNSENVSSNEEVSGFTVTSDGEELVRVIVQSGEKEPVLFLLRISGSDDAADLQADAEAADSGDEVDAASADSDVEDASAADGSDEVASVAAFDDAAASGSVASEADAADEALSTESAGGASSSSSSDGSSGSEEAAVSEQNSNASVSSEAYILMATADEGTWCSDFDPEESEFYIVVPYGTESAILDCTVSDGATVEVDGEVQTTVDGTLSLVLAEGGSTTISVTSEDGSTSSSYDFYVYDIYNENTPDAVVDYLCMGSEFTNSLDRDYYNGVYPEISLTGEYRRHVGNFGGYITYYFEEALVDDPNNEYGVDLYIYGDCYDDTRLIWAEPGQVYVSEDGDTWYALAGSEHYEEGTLWDYTITYERNDDDEAIWYDSLGNVMDTTLTYYYWAQYPTPWPSSEYYSLNDVSEQDSYTYTGILISDVVQSNTMANYPTLVDFGYVDCYGNGTIGESVNPYTATGYNNGFDLAWAVDDDGNPIDVSDMEFHYVKVATASNIWAGAMDEKGTDIQYIVRATPSDSEVGETDLPESVTVFCGDECETVELVEGQQVYEVEIDATGDASILVSGTADDDAIWVNSDSVDSGEEVSGFTVTSDGEELARVIVQNGEKEPVLFLLRISGK